MWSRLPRHCLAAAATVAVTAIGAPTPAAVAASEHDWLAKFLPIARAAWPGSPCENREAVATDAILPAAYAGLAWENECRVVISRGLFQLEFCDVLVHEFGHLAGRQNLTNAPEDVMNETPGPWPPCVAAISSPRTLSDEVRLVLPAPSAAWRLTIGPLQNGGCRYVRAHRTGWRVRRYKLCPVDDSIEITQTAAATSTTPPPRARRAARRRPRVHKALLAQPHRARRSR